MAAIDDLNSSVTALTAAVDAAVTDLNTPHPTDAQIAQATTAISAQTARLTAATTPASPPPASQTAPAAS